MILAYHRPKKVPEAIALLKENNDALPMGGGTTIRTLAQHKDIQVVDLQDVGLTGIQSDGDWITIGAMTTLNELKASSLIPMGIKEALILEGTNNTRNLATLGGRLNAVDGRSTLITVLIALDAITLWDEDSKEYNLGEWLAIPGKKPGLLMKALKFKRSIALEFQVINRTKLDLPILCVATTRWKSGRTRVAVGGFGNSPLMVFDGPDSNGASQAARSACARSEDPFGSKEYRQEMAELLTTRSIVRLEGQQ